MSALLFEVPSASMAAQVAIADPYTDRYLRVCEVMGSGYFYIPQSDICLRVTGSVEYDVAAGPDVYTGKPSKTWKQTAKAALQLDTKAETELGILSTYFGIEGSFADGADDGIAFSGATIELSGWEVGATDSQFDTWLGSAGNVLDDDVVPYAGGMTNQVNYTAFLGSGLSVLIGAEQGTKDESGDQGEESEKLQADDHLIDSYVPHLVGGVKLGKDWGAIATVLGYDSVAKEFAAKVRLDVQLNDSVSAFLMGGYQSDHEKPNYFGAWDGTYAAWSGISASLSPKATFNSQIALADSGTYALAINVDYEAVPGFIITPELDYVSFGAVSQSDFDDALGGVVSIKREF
ncbi:porin [Mesorhizobium sp. B4-1-3]|uniref:porin n=1 Tax=Mesorhizobium sp. B4-1-3 TaxID=2589889 RepID=UPI0015E34F05|nr:porin [Mesorhizobium sp. B4-1-3]